MAHSMDIPETNAFSPAPNGKMPPAVELEYLSRIVFLVVPASQTPPWLEDHIADCFKSDVDNFPASATWEQMVDMFRKVNKADPHYDPQILNVLVDLNEHGAHAEVFVLIQACGRPQYIIRHTIVRLRWRRRNGKWQLYHVLAIRAPNLFP